MVKKDIEEIPEEEIEQEGLLRQIELNTTKVRIAISTQDPEEDTDYLISRAIKVVDRYDGI